MRSSIAILAYYEQTGEVRYRPWHENDLHRYLTTSCFKTLTCHRTGTGIRILPLSLQDTWLIESLQRLAVGMTIKTAMDDMGGLFALQNEVCILQRYLENDKCMKSGRLPMPQGICEHTGGCIACRTYPI